MRDTRTIFVLYNWNDGNCGGDGSQQVAAKGRIAALQLRRPADIVTLKHRFIGNFVQ